MQDQQRHIENNKLKSISVILLKLDVLNFSFTYSHNDPELINNLYKLIILKKEAFSTEDRSANLC